MLDHAVNIRHFQAMRDPPRWAGLEETRKLAEYWKSRSRTIYINVELKSELNPWRMMDLNPRLSSAGVWTNTSTSFFKRMVKSIHYEDVALGARRPASTEQKEPSNPPLLSCRGQRRLEILVIYSLQDNDPNTTTSRSPSKVDGAMERNMLLLMSWLR